MDLSDLSIREIADVCRLSGVGLPREMLAAMERDPRAGVRRLAQRLIAGRETLRVEKKRLSDLQRFERQLGFEGFVRIAGVDEAGVAPLAGPVVAAAAILPRDYRLVGLNDSKKIPSEARRESLAAEIKRDAVAWAVGCAEVEEIDRLNIYQASLLAMRRAVEALQERPDYLLVDARTIPHCDIPQRGIVHGDALSASIAAASIIAKTTRDAMMAQFESEYPGWGFALHKGYPTPLHLEALKRLGASPIHRRSYAPVAEVVGGPFQRNLFQQPS